MFPAMGLLQPGLWLLRFFSFLVPDLGGCHYAQARDFLVVFSAVSACIPSDSCGFRCLFHLSSSLLFWSPFLHFSSFFRFGVCCDCRRGALSLRFDRSCFLLLSLSPLAIRSLSPFQLLMFVVIATAASCRFWASFTLLLFSSLLRTFSPLVVPFLHYSPFTAFGVCCDCCCRVVSLLGLTQLHSVERGPSVSE